MTVLFFAGACTVSFFLDFFQSSVISMRLFVDSSSSSSFFSSSSSSSPRRSSSRTVCSWHGVPLVAFTPMRFYFGAVSTCPPLRLLLGYPKYPVSKSKKHTPSGGGGRRRGEPTTGGAKLSSPTPRVFERRAQGKRGVSAVGWKNTTLLSPSSLRLNFSLAAHFSLRFIAFSLPRNILCTVLNISSVPFSR